MSSSKLELRLENTLLDDWVRMRGVAGRDIELIEGFLLREVLREPGNLLSKSSRSGDDTLLATCVNDCRKARQTISNGVVPRLTDSCDDMSYRVEDDELDAEGNADVEDELGMARLSDCSFVRGFFDATSSPPVESTRFLTLSFFSTTGVSLTVVATIFSLSTMLWSMSRRSNKKKES